MPCSAFPEASPRPWRIQRRSATPFPNRAASARLLFARPHRRRGDGLRCAGRLDLVQVAFQLRPHRAAQPIPDRRVAAETADEIAVMLVVEGGGGEPFGCPAPVPPAR